MAWLEAREQHKDHNCQAIDEAIERGWMLEHPVEECPNAIAPLWHCNYEALEWYGQIATGFAADLHVGGLMFERLLCDRPETDRLMLRKLTMIHQYFVTKQQAKHT